ncbi:MAG: hypothetical protein ACTSVB_10395 [Candidatus Heimdallarchaeaceae archaeon]
MQGKVNTYKDNIYGFFLGNEDGIMFKHRIFNKQLCPESVLENVVSSVCSFLRETDISDRGAITLSNSLISFIRIKDVTYVISHGISEVEEVYDILNEIAKIFEDRSKRRFHSGGENQLFSGASASFSEVVEEVFREIIIAQQRKTMYEETVETDAEEIILSDLEIVDFPISVSGESMDDQISNQKKKEKISEEKEEKAKPVSKEDHLRSISYNILNSLSGIKHLVFIEHTDNEAKMFFEYGEIKEKIVQQTVSICEKFLDEIIELMADKEEKSAIEVSKKYQIIFVPLNETNFMYAIATKSIDPIIMEPVFERIAKRIVKLVLDYKKEKSEN